MSRENCYQDPFADLAMDIYKKNRTYILYRLPDYDETKKRRESAAQMVVCLKFVLRIIV